MRDRRARLGLLFFEESVRVFCEVFVNWPIPDLHRVGAPGYRHDRRVSEMLGKGLRVDGRRGDDHLEVGPFRQEPGQIAQQEVNVEAAFVGFVDDDRVIGLQPLVVLQFGQEDAVGHDLHAGGINNVRGEAHLIADSLTEFREGLFCQTGRHRTGGNAPRLGVPDQPVDAVAQFQQDLRQLSGFARTGFAGHNDNLVVFYGLRDVIAATADGKFVGIFDVEVGPQARLAQPLQAFGLLWRIAAGTAPLPAAARRPAG